MLKRRLDGVGAQTVVADDVRMLAMNIAYAGLPVDIPRCVTAQHLEVAIPR